MQLIEEKKRAAEEKKKRAEVLKRKTNLGRRIHGLVSFVSEKDNIWELIGAEEIFHEDSKIDFFNTDLTKKDLLKMEKAQLKEDALLLDRIISFDKNDMMIVKLDQEDFRKFQKLLRGNDFLSNTSDSGSDVASDDYLSTSSLKNFQLQFQNSLNHTTFEEANNSMQIQGSGVKLLDGSPGSTNNKVSNKSTIQQSDQLSHGSLTNTQMDDSLFQ